MRSLIRTSFLLLALSSSAYAGDMPFPVAPPPPAPANAQISTQEPTADDVQDLSTTESTLAEITLTLLQSVLSLL